MPTFVNVFGPNQTYISNHSFLPLGKAEPALTHPVEALYSLIQTPLMSILQSKWIIRAMTPSFVSSQYKELNLPSPIPFP